MKKQIENIVKHSEVSEKVIEQHLRKQVKRLGGVCLKYSNPFEAGYPDRMVLMPQGRTLWVELKSKGGRVSKIQQIRIRQLSELGHLVYVADSKQRVDEILKLNGYDL